jgi:hypothetical protein
MRGLDRGRLSRTQLCYLELLSASRVRQLWGPAGEVGRLSQQGNVRLRLEPIDKDMRCVKAIR